MATHPSVIGEYTIVAPIAAAPSIDGHVYLGIDPSGANRVIKLGDIGTEDLVRSEARILAQLNNPHIATLCTVGEHEGRPYLTTSPHCRTSLERMMSAGPIDPNMLLDYATQTLVALDHAHGIGIYHRDLAPRHILINEGHVILCDFGNSYRPSLENSLGSASRLGSMPYMSVEQLAGKKPTPKMDLYALGMTLAHASLGRLWDRKEPIPDETVSLLVDKLVSPDGYHTAREAVETIAAREKRRPDAETLAYENKLLREHARDLTMREPRFITGFFLAGAITGGLIGGAIGANIGKWIELIKTY